MCFTFGRKEKGAITMHDNIEKEPSRKRVKRVNVSNLRYLYDFADSKHVEIPANIEVGKPHDCNPASYEDTKKNLREGVNQGRNIEIWSRKKIMVCFCM